MLADAVAVVVALKDPLNLEPRLVIDKPVVPSGVLDALVGDDSPVVRVGQHPMQVLLPDRL